MGSRMMQSVRGSLWEAFSKCTCPRGGKGKSRYSGGHGNYKQIHQRTQEHHHLIYISMGPRACGSPHLISYCTQAFSKGNASRISCLAKGFPITPVHRGIQPRFLSNRLLWQRIPPSAPSQRKANRRIRSCLPPANLKCSLSSCLLTAPFKKA